MCLLEGANEKKTREERRQSKCEKAAVGKIRKMTKRSVGMCVWVCLDGSAKQCWQDVLTGPFGTVEVLSVLINEALYPILHGPIKNWPGVCCTFLLNISSGWSSSRFIDYRKASKSLFLEPGRNGEVERTRTQQRLNLNLTMSTKTEVIKGWGEKKCFGLRGERHSFYSSHHSS